MRQFSKSVLDEFIGREGFDHTAEELAALIGPPATANLIRGRAKANGIRLKDDENVFAVARNVKKFNWDR